MTEQRVRVGGQALGDGVFMRTEKAWAIARADGSVETGAVPPNPVGRIPVVRVLVGLGVALYLGIGKGLAARRADGAGRRPRRSKANTRFLYIVVAFECVVAAISWLVGRVHLTGSAEFACNATLVVAALVAMRFVAPPAVWRYHGAEHKAVAAHEAEIDLGDLPAVLACPRVHPRCGTNLVVLVALIGVLLQHRPAVVQIVGFLLSVAVAAEILTLAGRWPTSIPSRILLAGGRVLQASVTTREPRPEEQLVACRALQAAIREHELIEQGVTGAMAPAGPPRLDPRLARQ